MLIDQINSPADLRELSLEELTQLSSEIRTFIVDAVSRTGGHLGSNLGAVELTLAVHRVYDSPRDIVLWDTGHQAYVHKIVTGRRKDFENLRQQGGMSGYPNRNESEHDWVENSHASTILSYAHGFATALDLQAKSVCKGAPERRVVAIIGDGALTGGMAYEALNNLGHAGRRCIIILNDNGRSYAPTVSKLSGSITRLRLNPSYVHTRQRLKNMLRELPAVGGIAYTSVHGLVSALRELVEPHVFFEALGVRYTGPIDGHDIHALETALHGANEWEDGPIVVHVVTEKGHGYGPAVDDEVQRLHDLKVAPAVIIAKDSADSQAIPAANGIGGLTAASNGHGANGASGLDSATHSAAARVYPRRPYTEVFTESLLHAASRDPRIVAITAAMPGPTGLLPFQDRFPDRFLDVGIAEQHAVTAAAGMAMAGLRPVVAVYSTFFSRAFDQANLDVGLHNLPVVFVLDRAGITGDDGASHHGVLDMALSLAIPGMTIFAPSSAQELPIMLEAALDCEGPAMVRFPKTLARVVPDDEVGSGLGARLVRRGSDVCILAVGKMVEAAENAAAELERQGVSATVWDVRVLKPADNEMIVDASTYPMVVTVEDGIRVGGAGSYLTDLIASVDGSRRCPPTLNLGTPIEYLQHSKPDAILARLGLDGPGIAASILVALHAGSPSDASPIANLS